MPHTRAAEFIDIDTNAQTLRLRGAWTVFEADVIRAVLRRHKKDLQGMTAASPALRVDLTDTSAIDTVGAWLIRHYVGADTSQWTMTERQERLLAFLPATPPRRPAREDKSLLADSLRTLGERASAIAAFLYGIVAFMGLVFCRLFANLIRPAQLRPAAITRHIFETGIAALPIIGLLAFLMSMVVSYQGALQLQKFGADIFTIDLTVISMLREMAPLVTAIMVAGRSGSAFAAEIGVMRLRKETDALEAMGLDPVGLLVIPRLLALMLTLPLLTFFADIVGIGGGALMSWSLLDIGLGQYIARVSEVATPMMYIVGMIKAPVFAFVISVICTYHGMNVTGSAESVGKVTTIAVVQSIFMVILVDAAFSILFAELGI
jgi:phospholipid/cholesterol/gamma-HCH transport system permease protein